MKQSTVDLILQLFTNEKFEMEIHGYSKEDTDALEAAKLDFEKTLGSSNG